MIKADLEKKTLFVIILTLLTMFAEVIFGYLTHSMALFADGCHMGTHALALSITFLTYVLIRKFSDSQSFVFGTGKFSVLSGFTSSVLLGITGIFIIKEALERYFNPLNIDLNEAILVALIGFAVNLLCIAIMGEKEHCHGGCEHSHNEDYNFKAAYLHILADLMTSIFAIGALLAAKFAGWNFLDPIVGLLGGIVILIWAVGLIKSTSMILLDAEVLDLKTEIEEHLGNKFKFDELHVWKTSENKYALLGKVSTSYDLNGLKSKIYQIAEFSHVYIEYCDTSHN